MTEQTVPTTTNDLKGQNAPREAQIITDDMGTMPDPMDPNAPKPVDHPPSKGDEIDEDKREAAMADAELAKIKDGAETQKLEELRQHSQSIEATDGKIIQDLPPFMPRYIPADVRALKIASVKPPSEGPLWLLGFEGLPDGGGRGPYVIDVEATDSPNPNPGDYLVVCADNVARCFPAKMFEAIYRKG